MVQYYLAILQRKQSGPQGHTAVPTASTTTRSIHHANIPTTRLHGKTAKNPELMLNVDPRDHTYGYHNRGRLIHSTAVPYYSLPTTHRRT
jgi:hypothetical protein